MSVVFGTDAQRAELIVICERAIVPEDDWHDRDSASSHRQLGECWAQLRAGCRFELHGSDGDPPSDEQTHWVTVYSEGFQYHENHESGDDQLLYMDKETYYLPTANRLDKAAGKDWY